MTIMSDAPISEASIPSAFTTHIPNTSYYMENNPHLVSAGMSLPEIPIFSSHLLPSAMSQASDAHVDYNLGLASYLPPATLFSGIATSPFSPLPPNTPLYPPISEPSESHRAMTPMSLRIPMETTSYNATGYPSPMPRHLTASPVPYHSHQILSDPTTPPQQSNSQDALGIQRTASPLVTPLPSPGLSLTITPLSGVNPHASPMFQRQYTPIAPNPAGLMQLQTATKRAFNSDGDCDYPRSNKRRSSTSSVASHKPGVELSEEDLLLIRLKDEENLAWKDVASRFEAETGKTYHVPALQMRLKRLKERMKVWSECDVRALRLAHEYWLNNKWELIASKMSEFGSSEKWSAKQCGKQWTELGPEDASQYHAWGATSPARGPVFTGSPSELSLGFTRVFSG